MTVYKIVPRRYDHPANRLEEAQVWRGSRALLCRVCRTMSPGALIGASRCFSRPTTIAFIASSSPWQLCAPSQPENRDLNLHSPD